MITIIGDVHGKWPEYYKLLKKIDGHSIQLGDMGVGFSRGKQYPEVQDRRHRWFRGNHDNPEICYECPNYLGDYGYIEEDNIFWLAGAFSIDYMWRTPGRSWWADEELSCPELEKAIALYKEKKPKFVISHDAPKEAAIWMLTKTIPGFRPEKMDCATSRTSEALQLMHDFHKPKEWIFGHYHVDVSFEWKETKFTCVNELSTYELETQNV